MFDNLSDRLSHTLKRIKGQARLTEDNIQAALREVRLALLEADVALPVVREFTDAVKQRALGKDVLESLSPGQAFIKVVNDTLVEIMGQANESLALKSQPPAVILMAGLQGAGKTTTAGKLAKFLQEREKLSKIMVASCDIYRPAAIKQLETVAEQAGASFFASEKTAPVEIAQDALAQAKRDFMDVLIVDTAGRLHIDAEMMTEIQAIHQAINPIETLFVVDSMTGQDAANTAKSFDEALPLTGVVLTKTDGDARGGAALSIRQITGKPIKFLGVGEQLTALEAFHPDRMASRILGMGDVLTLIEEAQQKVDHKKAQKLAKKINKGRAFNFDDLKSQIQQMEKMGGLDGLMGKLPGMGAMSAKMPSATGEKSMKRMVAIINSMTPNERRHPDLIKASRKKRIALGAGVQIQEVNRLMKQQQQMGKMMKKLKGGGMQKMMRAMGGKMPPGGSGGFPPFG